MSVHKINEIVSYETESGAQVTLSPQIIRSYLVNGQGNVTDQEVTMFLQLCKYQGLNPFLREAYLIKYGDRNPATIVIGKEVFTKRAARHPEFAGMEAGVYVLTKAGEIKERKGTIVVQGEQIVGGWARVYRKGYQVPFEYTCAFDEYVQRKADGSVNQQWSTKPGTMIRKCAVVAALREAFPVEFGGMYSQEEISTVDASILPDNPIPHETPLAPVQAPEAPAETIHIDPPPKAEDKPPAKPQTLAKMISEAQIGLIKKLMRENQVPEDDFKYMIAPKTSVKELTSSEASQIISQLQKYVGEIPFD